MNEICSFLQKYTKSSGSILDIIMDALESHNDELEEKVNERTADLNQVRGLKEIFEVLSCNPLIQLANISSD